MQLPAEIKRSRRSLGQWITYITEREMPVFKQTVMQVAQSCKDEKASNTQLSHVILQDANLTARVLKIANSTYYNPSRANLTTVSRAVLLIGFNSVRDLCLTLTVIDALLKHRAREHVLELMARAFHAAVQAKAMAELRYEADPEEVFIASLLYRLGEMAFYCVAEQEGESILTLIESSHYTVEQAETEVLGFKLGELTSALTREWRLGSLLTDSIYENVKKDRRVKTVLISHKLADFTRNGWKGTDVQRLTEEIADYLGMSIEETRFFLRQNARRAVDVARSFGASKAAEYIPTLDRIEQTIVENEQQLDKFPRTDPMLQLNILRELSLMLSGTPDINQVLDVTMEGIYRGVGLDRVVLALVKANNIEAKHAIGFDQERLVNEFNFDIHKEENIFSYIFDKRQPLQLNDSSPTRQIHLTTPEIREVLEVSAFFIYPLYIGEKPIGLIYADRKPSGRVLDNDDFISFCHFGQQAAMAMDILGKKRN